MKSNHIVLDALRFLLAGIVNTALTYLVYLFFLLYVSYQLAYALSWIFGLIIIAIFYPSKVFVGSDNSWKKVMLLMGQYGLVFACGLLSLKMLVHYGGISPVISAVVVMVFTAGLNFILMRLLYRKKFLH